MNLFWEEIPGWNLPEDRSLPWFLMLGEGCRRNTLFCETNRIQFDVKCTGKMLMVSRMRKWGPMISIRFVWNGFKGFVRRADMFLSGVGRGLKAAAAGKRDGRRYNGGEDYGEGTSRRCAGGQSLPFTCLWSRL
jgi:hypothetical protein